MDDPFDQLRALQSRLADLVDELGLDLASIEFIPHGEHGNLVHFIAQVREDTLKTNEEVETDAVRSEFDSLIGSFEVIEGEDGPTISDVDEVEEEPEDPALEEAEAKMQEKARERAAKLLQQRDDE